MAYEESAATALEADPQKDEVPAKASKRFFLPDDFPERGDYRAGDTITLKVVGEDADGRLEAECMHDDEEKDWKSDMRETMGPNMDGKQPI
jgi:hypothetical protein